MRVKLRLAAVGVAFLIPAIVMAAWSVGSSKQAVVAPILLPTEVGPWVATNDRQLGAEVWDLIQPDAHIMRLYEAPERTPIWLYMGVYAGRSGSSKGAHDPEICYPSQGWEIVRTHSQRLSVEGAGTLRATFLEVHHGLRKEVVAYWFQPAARWPAGSAAEQLLRVYDALAQRPQYAFVRFSGPSDGGPAAERDLAEFASAMAPAIRVAVERLGSNEDETRHANL